MVDEDMGKWTEIHFSEDKSHRYYHISMKIERPTNYKIYMQLVVED